MPERIACLNRAERHKHHGSDQRAQRHGGRAMILSGALAAENVDSPTGTCTKRKGRPGQVDMGDILPQRQKEPQPQHGQHYPDKVYRTPGGEQRDRQRAGKLQRHRNTQRHRLDREIEEIVHRSQRQPIK